VDVLLQKLEGGCRFSTGCGAIHSNPINPITHPPFLTGPANPCDASQCPPYLS
jgi:hypothetical protein